MAAKCSRRVGLSGLAREPLVHKAVIRALGEQTARVYSDIRHHSVRCPTARCTQVGRYARQVQTGKLRFQKRFFTLTRNYMHRNTLLVRSVNYDQLQRESALVKRSSNGGQLVREVVLVLQNYQVRKCSMGEQTAK